MPFRLSAVYIERCCTRKSAERDLLMRDKSATFAPGIEDRAAFGSERKLRSKLKHIFYRLLQISPVLRIHFEKMLMRACRHGKVNGFKPLAFAVSDRNHGENMAVLDLSARICVVCVFAQRQAAYLTRSYPRGAVTKAVCVCPEFFNLADVDKIFVHIFSCCGGCLLFGRRRLPGGTSRRAIPAPDPQIQETPDAAFRPLSGIRNAALDFLRGNACRNVSANFELTNAERCDILKAGACTGRPVHA